LFGDTVHVAGGIEHPDDTAAMKNFWALDLSGELRGDLVAEGREIAAFLPMDPKGKIANFPFVWDPQYHNGLVYASDFNSGLWVMKLESGDLTP
jgi:hypothetical protein